MYLLSPPQKKIRQSCGSEVFPPVLAVVEDGAFAFLAILFLEKRDLVADSEFYVFSDMTMGLGKSLKIHIVPDTVFQAEADIMTGLLTARTVSLVKQRKS